MTTEKRDREMVEEAKGILAEIVTHQKNSTDRLSQFEKQVDELKRAQRLMEESVYRAAPEVGNDNSGPVSYTHLTLPTNREV